MPTFPYAARAPQTGPGARFFGMPPSLRMLLAVLALLLLQACSATRLAYQQAPTLLYWRMDSYLDLDPQQAPRLRESLTRLQHWHRGTQLPGYAQLLLRLRKQLAGELSAEQACAALDEARGWLAQLLDQQVQQLDWLGATLSDDQLARLARQQASADAEWRAKWLVEPEALQAQRLRQWQERAETLYGRMDAAQVALLRRLVQQSGFEPQRAYAERLRRQKDLIQTLQTLRTERLEGAAARPPLQALARRLLQSPDAAYHSYAERQLREGCANVASLHASTSPAQRAHAQQVLQDYAEDFQALVGQP